MTAHILLVDDDDLLRRSLALNLEEAGYRASTAAHAEAAFEAVRRDPPDLILLDIGLPGMDGIDALRQFRQAAQNPSQDDIPIIFLTARRRELDQALGLELGADDYITKPFNLSILLARIKAVLRRIDRSTPTPASSQTLTVGDMIIDPAAHTVTVDGAPIELSPLEFEMLHTLALDPGHVISIDELLNRVWGTEYVGEPQIVYVHIRSLRQRLEKDPKAPRRIVTVRGVGYKLEPNID
jgi:DNA-binding response OmpR family regulator